MGSAEPERVVGITVDALGIVATVVLQRPGVLEVIHVRLRSDAMAADPVLWRERLGELIERGVAIIVATCDEDGHPSLTRGWGPAFGEDDEVLLAVTAAPGTRSAADLIAGAEVSVTVSEMTTYSTVQLLGTAADVTAIDDDARRRVDTHLERFAADAAKVGVTHDATSVFLDDLILVHLMVRRASEQTPGARAGAPLEEP
jgi:hypothetical protein